MKKFYRIETGYRAANGYIFTESDARAYNSHNADVERLRELVKHNISGSLTNRVYETALDTRNKVYKAITGMQ